MTDPSDARTSRHVWQTVCRYGLIRPSDRVLIGLSGGKDSLTLVSILGERARIFPPRFSVSALHVSVEGVPYLSDLDFLRAHCARHDVPFHHLTVPLPTPREGGSARPKPMCLLCSRARRNALFSFARDHRFNKVALGHHADDLIHTFLMNLTFQGSISTMPPLLQMTRFPLAVIRPLAHTPECEMTAWTTRHAYPRQLKSCPYERTTARTSMRDVVERLEALNPEFRASVLRAMENILPDYLPRPLPPETPENPNPFD